MLKIIPATDFKQVPWKNGKGVTTELAINDGGTLTDFIWRLSIASVVENGVFSNFSGYQRNLVLIEGQGIMLCHDNNHTDKLSKHLDFATFDGGSETVGTLPDQAIKDFNIITKDEQCLTKVSTFIEHTAVTLAQGLYFVFSLAGDVEVVQTDNQKTLSLTKGDLLQIADEQNIEISGEQLIVVNLQLK
jgi:environmental stress-induced protein Ves